MLAVRSRSAPVERHTRSRADRRLGACPTPRQAETDPQDRSRTPTRAWSDNHTGSGLSRRSLAAKADFLPAMMASMDHVAGDLRRLPSVGEEVANSISHGVVALAAIIAGPFLIIRAAHRGGALSAVGMTVFVVTLVLLYL